MLISRYNNNNINIFFFPPAQPCRSTQCRLHHTCRELKRLNFLAVPLPRMKFIKTASLDNPNVHHHKQNPKY